MSRPKVVLTASEIEMCDFEKNPFIAFAAGFPTTFLLVKLIKGWNKHPGTIDGIRAKLAPYGLRKVEAALLNDGFDEREVVVVHPKELPKVVNDSTRVVGISSMDPLGYAFVSITYSTFVGGTEESFTAKYFRKLMANKYIKKIPVKIVGGAGAWQLTTKTARNKFRINTVVVGEGVSPLPELFRKAVNGEPLPKVLNAGQDSLDSVPDIVYPSINGAVRITRGCGRGCHFCTPTMRRRESVPLEKVINEIKVNVKYGYDMITLVTDDLFLYGLKDPNFIPNETALVKLFSAITSIKGVRYIQPAHAALAPVVAAPKTFEKIAELTYGFGRYAFRGKRWMAVEVGIESGSPRLMSIHMAGKSKPIPIEKWQETVVEAVGMMNDYGWIPLGTLIVGMPEENDDDVMKTLELLDKLKKHVIFLVPLLFTPLAECALRKERRADLRKFNDLQWEVFIKCWEHNIHTWRPDWLGEYQYNLAITILRRFLSMAVYALYYRWYSPRMKRIVLNVGGWFDKYFDLERRKLGIKLRGRREEILKIASAI